VKAHSKFQSFCNHSNKPLNWTHNRFGVSRINYCKRAVYGEPLSNEYKILLFCGCNDFIVFGRDPVLIIFFIFCIIVLLNLAA